MLSQESVHSYGCACRWVVDNGQVAQCATHADLQAELDVLRADCTRFLQRITRYEQEIGALREQEQDSSCDCDSCTEEF